MSSDAASGSRILLAGFLLMALALAALFPATRFVAVGGVVAGGSMEPTLSPGDRVLVDLWTYRHRPPRIGEVALLVGPGDELLVKRIARTPGETAALGASVRGDGRVWVVGDNPEMSEDSRNFGPVPRERIRGRVVWRYWPPLEVGPIR